MYLPKMFEETRPEVLQQLLREHPLGTLVVMTANGLDANHIPFEYEPQPLPWGTLHGHVSRANPVWRDFSPDTEALAIFQGPQSYVSPSWYPSKQETGKAVPTWNYVVVHARGPLKVIDDSQRLRTHVEHLVARHERHRNPPWQVTDAPADYIEKQLSLIVAIEIPLTSLRGKWKVGQNRTPRDRQGMLEGLLQEGRPEATALAAAMRTTSDVP